MNCPDFDDDEYEKILEWAEAEVEYEDSHFFATETSVKRVFKGFWTLHWKHGFIGFTSFFEREEKKARMAAAMFIYLYSNGVMASIASELAELYVGK